MESRPHSYWTRTLLGQRGGKPPLPDIVEPSPGSQIAAMGAFAAAGSFGVDGINDHGEVSFVVVYLLEVYVPHLRLGLAPYLSTSVGLFCYGPPGRKDLVYG